MSDNTVYRGPFADGSRHLLTRYKKLPDGTRLHLAPIYVGPPLCRRVDLERQANAEAARRGYQWVIVGCDRFETPVKRQGRAA